jgi:peptidoglycan/LPS O-acetylase OafA/YrhL
MEATSRGRRPAHKSAATARRYGGFSAIRLIAALAVVYAHSFDLTGNRLRKPMFYIGDQQIRLGRIGVDVFFVMSGFLIAASWDRSSSLYDYARKRFARVWPALTCVVVLSVVVLGPLATKFSIGDYFSRSATYEYAWHNLTMFFGMRHELPGVFSNAAQGSVNGPLWTLPYELWGYVVIAALGCVRQLRRGPLLYLMLAATVSLFHFSYLGKLELRGELAGMGARDAVELATMFLLGALLSRVGDRLNERITLASGISMIATAFAFGIPAVYFIGLGLAVIGAGGFEGSITRAFDRLGDPSYGIYLFSYPLQQILYTTGAARTPSSMVVASFALSLLVGYISWYCIERPGLAWIVNRRPRQPKEHADRTL